MPPVTIKLYWRARAVSSARSSGGIARVVNLNAVQPAGADQIPGKRHTFVNARVGQHSHAAAGFDEVKHGINRLILWGMQDLASHRTQAKQGTIHFVIHAIRKAVLPKYPHDMRFVQRAAVLLPIQALPPF